MGNKETKTKEERNVQEGVSMYNSNHNEER